MKYECPSPFVVISLKIKTAKNLYILHTMKAGKVIFSKKSLIYGTDPVYHVGVLKPIY